VGGVVGGEGEGRGGRGGVFGVEESGVAVEHLAGLLVIVCRHYFIIVIPLIISKFTPNTITCPTTFDYPLEAQPCQNAARIAEDC